MSSGDSEKQQTEELRVWEMKTRTNLKQNMPSLAARTRVQRGTPAVVPIVTSMD